VKTLIFKQIGFLVKINTVPGAYKIKINTIAKGLLGLTVTSVTKGGTQKLPNWP
jgi:hypothetical protein